MKVLYNSLFKRTSTYAIGIMFSAFFFERTFDVLSETIFESANKGAWILLLEYVLLISPKVYQAYRHPNALVTCSGFITMLEQIFSIAYKREFFCKVTGAGAGGYVIVLLPNNYAKNEVCWKLKEELEAAGFGVHSTTAGGDGLSIEKL
uniref:Cytochrome b-c1 complex subunit 9 n=1 Tax=Glossina palpalis gambiensis TaxID=67801 RepID=A0A1B0BEB1_9MUSC